jgi:hypothetical protein
MSETVTPPPDPPDPHTSLCGRCSHSQIETSTFVDQFKKSHHQILVHCLRLHETIWWSPDGLFGQTYAVCRLPETCTGFREQKQKLRQEEEGSDDLTNEVKAALRAFQDWSDQM